MKTVLDIVHEYLVAAGYDGLYNEDGDCACLLDAMAPCCHMTEDCQAGIRVPTEYREDRFGNEYDWRIVAENPTDPEVRKLVSIVCCRRPKRVVEKRETVSAGPDTVKEEKS